jgi:hypothetical protein
MPILRRRETIRRLDLENLTPAQRRHLLSGTVYVDEGGFRDAETFRLAWDMHRDSLTEEWIQSERKHWSMVRPFAWWFADHGKERPIVSPLFSADEIEASRNGEHRFENFGFLHTTCWKVTGKAPDYVFHHMQEPEGDYLDRLNLLSDEERKYLDALDAKPESQLDPAPFSHKWPDPRNPLRSK